MPAAAVVRRPVRVPVAKPITRLVGGALALLAAAVGPAATADEPTVAPADAEAAGPNQRVVALRSMLAVGGPLEIRGEVGGLDFLLPLPAGTVVNGALLKLGYSAEEVVAERSRLLVALNGVSLAELPITSDKRLVRAEITLPPALLQGGSTNRLSVTALQEHRDGCGIASAADLATYIDPVNSYLVLDVTLPERSATLDGLLAPDWSIATQGLPLAILTPGPIEGDLLLRAGGLVAQGYALRLGDRPIEVRHAVLPAAGTPPPPAGETPPEGTDAGVAVDRSADAAATADGLPDGQRVLVGPRDALTGVVGSAFAAGITGPYLGVYGSGGGAPLLVVSGRDEDEVLRAATAFSNPDLTLPAAPSLVIGDGGAAEFVPEGQPYLQPGRTYRFSELDSSGGPGGAGLVSSLTFLLPPDYYVADNRKAEIRLGFAYGAKLGPGATLHVLVNGLYAGLIPLDDPRGAVVDGEPMRVPLRLLRPGRNTLAFKAVALGGGGGGDRGGCVPRADTGVGIFGDSTISLPEVARVAHQPDLHLFESVGFPYGASGGGAGVDLVVASHDSPTISAGWTLAAKLAQIARAPLPRLNVTFDLRPTDHQLLVVGARESLDARLLARTPLDLVSLQGTGLAPEQAVVVGQTLAGVPVTEGTTVSGGAAATAAEMPALNRRSGTMEPGSRFSDREAWERQLRMQRSADYAASAAGAAGGIGAQLRQLLEDPAGALGRLLPVRTFEAKAAGSPIFVDTGIAFDGAVAAVESPFAEQTTLTLVTAADPEALRGAVGELVKPVIWEQLAGDTAAWTTWPPAVASARVAEPFRLGAVPDRFRQRVLFVNSFLAERPGLWLAAVLLGLLAATALTRIALAFVQRS